MMTPERVELPSVSVPLWVKMNVFAHRRIQGFAELIVLDHRRKQLISGRKPKSPEWFG